MSLSRRALLRTVSLAGAGLAVERWSRPASAQTLKPLTLSHRTSAFVYGQHLVAKEKKFFEDEGVSVPSFIVPYRDVKVSLAVAGGQATFALGNFDHPLTITEKGTDAVMIFATDTRCGDANICVRRELWERGVRSVEALADRSLVGRRAVIATATGSSSYVYGVYVLKQHKAADGKSVNDHVEWVGGGSPRTSLRGFRDRRFDAIMVMPEWQWAVEDEGSGKAIYDVQEEKAWARVFGGRVPVTVGYALRETIEKSPALVQAYVNAAYRAQQWIRQATGDEIVELFHKPYMEELGISREVLLRSVTYYRAIFDWDFVIEEKDYANGMKVWRPLAGQKAVPYARAVDMSFVKEAHAKRT